MQEVFRDATAFQSQLSNWNIGAVTTMAGALNNTNLSCESYSNTLYLWFQAANTPSNINLGANQLLYSQAVTPFRDSLISEFNWTITGDAFDASCNIPNPPNVPLPVELVYFSVSEIKNKQVLIEWETYAEVNNRLFVVEKSPDGIHWQSVSEVEGAGFSSEKFYTTPLITSLLTDTIITV